MTWTARSLAQQTGRTFVVTGGNSGIGLEAGRELVARGAHVVLACRDLVKGEQAKALIAPAVDSGGGDAHTASGGADGRVTVLQLDLSDLDSVAEFAGTVARSVPALSALVCNAGVMGGRFALTAQGFERQMGTNHLGHAALVTALWPQLVAAAGRIVLVSSIAARSGDLTADSTVDDLVAPAPYIPMKVYARTKQANLLYALELHRRAAAAGSPVTAVAAHPGLSATNLVGRLLRDSGRGWLVPVAVPALRLAGQSATAGAQPTLRALDHSTPGGSFVGPARLGQWRGRPELLDVYASAGDPAVGSRLWDLTTQVLGAAAPV